MKNVSPRNLPKFEQHMTLQYFCDVVRSELSLSKPLGDTCEIIRRAIFETIVINAQNSKIASPNDQIPNMYEEIAHKLLLEYKNFTENKKSINTKNYNEHMKDFYFWFLELYESFAFTLYDFSKK